MYLQYSNRQEIVNNKATGEGSGNVLLVGMEGVAPDSVSIDVLHVQAVVTEYHGRKHLEHMYFLLSDLFIRSLPLRKHLVIRL